MKKHFKYLSYIIRHKWFVLLAGIKVGAPVCQIITHDLSKLLPSEWFPYVNKFYGRLVDAKTFDVAWLKHQNRNPHHWQYWILEQDGGASTAMHMPDKYVREMVADWAGAGRAITGRWDIQEWHKKNKHQMFLARTTESQVEALLLNFPKEAS